MTLSVIPSTQVQNVQRPAIQQPEVQRPGKKRVAVAENPRTFRSQPVKTKARRSYNSRKKIEVLSYLSTPSIPEEGNPEKMRVPTLQEASEYFGGIPQSCISTWRRDESEILKGVQEKDRKIKRFRDCNRWPEMEKIVYSQFLRQREKGQIVRRSWFRYASKKAFQECYPNSEKIFSFSQGWFVGFLTRYNISIRFTTNRAQKIPQDYLTPIINFFRFVRRNLHPRNGDVDYLDDIHQLGRITSTSRIANMDQTPAPFEYLSGRTYESKGSHTVWAKAEKSGWDKRQATIQLTVLADGTMLKPWIIYRGKGFLPEAELNQYDPRVTVKFNDEAYANETIILEWIHQQLIPIIHRKDICVGQISHNTGLPTGIPAPNSLGLVALDAASFHRTPTVLKTLQESNIIPCLIPSGCTSLIQVLDVSVNRPFKDILKETMEEELYRLVQLRGEDVLYSLDAADAENTENAETQGPEPVQISAVGLRRILLTRAVGTAWEKFGAERHKNSIIKTFRRYI